MAKEKRTGILSNVTDRTKVIALICLIVEVLFLASLPAFPSDQKIYILLVFGLILAITLLGLIFLEYTASRATPELRRFCKGVAGRWWSLRADPGSVGFVTIEPEETTSTLSVKGRAYDSNGDVVAVWESIASCINLNRKKLYYYWQGWWTEKPGERYQGFGEISFHGSTDRSDTGNGVFSDTNLTDVTSTRMKSSDFLRCTAQEVDIMQGTDKKRIGGLVREKL